MHNVISFVLRLELAIKTQGFRNLAEGKFVEFLIDFDPDGRSKAFDVTNPDGSDVRVAMVEERRWRRRWELLQLWRV
ncbi:putative glycine-rich protein 2-like [Sesbania bispinosa]|nr:putative glycine-rich protein 2-like [Sesbania bispinosa]